MTSAEKYVTKQIVASQKFLLGLLSLPSFRDIETKQALGLFKVVDKYSGFTSQQSANILQQLDQRVWSAETLKTLREKLAEKTIAPEVTVQGSRRVNQDYLALPNYLTKELWRAIQDESQSRDTVLQQLVSYSGLLGLRCPTEYSAAMLVVLAYGPQMVTQRLGPAQKFELYKQRRPQMKKWFLQMLPPVLYLEALPALPQELPVQIRQLVLSDGQDFVPPLYSYANLLQIANSYPVRGTNMEVVASQAHVVAGALPQQQLASTAVALGQAVAAQMLVPQKPETNVSYVEPKSLCLLRGEVFVSYVESKYLCSVSTRSGFASPTWRLLLPKVWFLCGAKVVVSPTWSTIMFLRGANMLSFPHG